MKRLGRGPAAAFSVVLAAAAGAGINIATSSPGWAVICAVVLLVGVWAWFEWRRAGQDGDAGASRRRLRIGQRLRRVGKGEVVGAQGLPADADLDVAQRVSEVGDGGSVIGYRADKDK